VPRPFRYVTTLLVALALAVPATASALPSLSANPANKLLKRGIDPIRYDKATHCTGHATKGANALVAWLQKNSAGVNWGIYRCEMWGKHEASLHAEGRAIDWHLDAGNPAEKRAAYKLIELLLAPDKQGNQIALARRMGVQGLIFNCQSWWGSPDGELGEYSYCYGKNGKRKKGLDRTQAHMNHIHIELNKRGAAKKTTFWNPSITYPLEDLSQTGQDEENHSSDQRWWGNEQSGGTAQQPSTTSGGGSNSWN
jgi:hypothetical protein